MMIRTTAMGAVMNCIAPYRPSRFCQASGLVVAVALDNGIPIAEPSGQRLTRRSFVVVESCFGSV